MYRISYRFLVPGWSAKPLVSAHDPIMGTHRPRSHLGPAPPALLGLTLIVGCVDADTGELHPITVVIDNGPAIESVAAACWFAHRPHFASWPEPDSVHSSDYARLVVGRWSSVPDSELRQERCRVDL